MPLADQARQSRDCPNREALAAYSAGKLPSRLVEVVGAHVAGCLACQSSLEEVQDETGDSDTLIGKLRGCFAATQAPRERDNLEPATPNPASAEVLTASDSPTTVSLQEGSPPIDFGQYELLEQIGHGGMGVVYKARQGRLKRLVAIKMIRSGAHGTASERARFAVECEALARLQHPHVVQVHEFNEQAGQLYLCMEFLEGGTLADRLPSTGLPVREAGQLVQVLAETVHAAHQRHIVHRDLKPANVLRTADGILKIGDFGLAKLLDADEGHTGPDAIMGTPSYMAPEQAEGNNMEVGPLTDVHALGAILYQALTGQPPFKGASRMATLELVRTAEPVPPSRLRREVPRDLEAICLKCLAKKPGQRYESAQALAEDLGRWRRGAPTLARPAPWYARNCRALLAVILLAAAGLAIWWFFRPPGKPVFVPGVWYELLDRRPTVLLGPDAETDSWCKYEPKSHELWVNSEDPCIFQLGEVDAEAFDLEVTFSQNPVVGGVGLFYQGREQPGKAGTKPWGEFVLLRPFDVLKKSESALLERGFLMRGPGPRLFLNRLRSEKIAWPAAGPQTIQIAVGPEGLTNVFLSAAAVHFTSQPPATGRAGARGIVGVMTQTSSATIRSARLRVRPIP